jgi:hypothetical protein
VFHVKRAAALVVLAVAAVYAGDYLWARLRGARALDTVQVQPYYAVPLRDGKTEFMLLDPENRTCVRALFPHFGYGPCWYVKGTREQRIDM